MQKYTKGLGVVGTILIVFAVIALAITKLLNWYVYTHLILGLAAIIAYSVFNFENFMTRIRERSTTEGARVAVYGAIIVCIIILLNVVSYRKMADKRWDVTERGIYTLETQTKQLLESLKTPIRVTAAYNAKNQQKPMAKDLLETYAYHSKNFRYEFVDPDRQPDLASRYKLKDGDLRFEFSHDDLTLDSFDESKLRNALKERISQIYYFADAPNETPFLKLRQLLNSPEFQSRGITVQLTSPSGQLPVEIGFKPKKGQIHVAFAKKDTVIRAISEQDFTNAIIQISSQVAPKVYFSSGHGEHDLGEENERGYSILKTAIQNEGYEVKKIEGSLTSGLPADASILVIAGPVTPYAKEEVDSVEKFLNSGGKVVLLLEPQFSDARLNPKLSIRETGFESFLNRRGVDVGRDLILEKHLQILQGVRTEAAVMGQSYGSHDITAPLNGRMTFFPTARSVRRAKNIEGGLVVTELIMSGGEGASWAETNINDLVRNHSGQQDSADIAGPVSIAAVSELAPSPDSKNPGNKLIVFGDSEFVSNQNIRTQEFNYDLFLNSLNWMWGKKEQISIRPKSLRSSKLVLTPEQTNIIFYAAVLTIPEAILILGLMIYFRRRNR